MTCNYCRCNEHNIIYNYTRFEKKDVLQCKNCGLVYLEIKKSKEKIESFYSSEYRKVPTHPMLSPDELFQAKITQNDANDHILFISNYTDIQDKRILEIGSATGSLLYKLLEHGAKEVIGVELNKKFSKYAQQKGVKVFTRPIEELDFKEEFDTVVSFHVLEHVYDPVKAIQAVYAGLKKGGEFFGEIPNQNDWRIQIFNDEIVKRFHYDPDHYYYYSPTTLKNYLETCSFENIRLETVERYNSYLQLKNILRNQDSDKNIDEILKKRIFPKTKADDVRLPNLDNRIETEFNRIFEKAVNSELMGNCLRWVAYK